MRLILDLQRRERERERGRERERTLLPTEVLDSLENTAFTIIHEG